MRQLQNHKVGLLGSKIDVNVDDPRVMGANTRYVATAPTADGEVISILTDVQFQDGPVADIGVKGISPQVLLAITQDHLAGLNSGEMGCHELRVALNHIHEALNALDARTRRLSAAA